MLKLRNTYRWLLVVGCVVLPLAAYAQVQSDPVQYAVAPETPGPNAQVVIEADGVGGFLGNATITWRKNGVVVAQGTGVSRYTFTTGALGSRTEIKVTIDSPTQGTFSKTFNFSPSLVNLVWEANTTVPPLFLGKPMYSAGSPLRVLALPVVYSGSSRIAPGALSYNWSRNDEPQPDASGLGRASYAFVGDQLKTGEHISVDILYGTATIAHGEVVVPAAQPALVLYERDALRGLLLDSAFPPAINLMGKEITLQAQPFYFSSPDYRAGNLTYSWQLNGNDATGPDTGSGILTLRQTGSGTGSAVVGVSLQNYGADSFVQQASALLQLNFGAAGSALQQLFGI